MEDYLLMRISLLSVSAALALAGCSSNPSLPAANPESGLASRDVKATSTYVYVADRSQEKLLVYPAFQQNPSPTRTVTGFTEINGIATDSSGNVYVANGSGGTVIEYAPGATSVVRTLSQGLNDPVNVATDASGNVYVANQNSTNSAIVEFPPGTSVTPTRSITTPLGHSSPPRGVVVDPAGDIFITISGIGDFWPPASVTGYCLAITGAYEYPAGGSAWSSIFLSRNEQAWGIALDTSGKLYASDFCLNRIDVYTPPSYSYLNGVSGLSESNPVYLTISPSNIMAVPDPGGPYVTVSDLNGVLPEVTISTGLVGPSGAALGIAP